MKALIVDDDIFSIKGLKKGVAWEEDGIDEVHQVVSAAAAREILKEKAIDIMICDIEMPNETGIELLHWIRKKQIPLVVIFYSCHADFIYAQNAVKLQVFDYVLKPAPYGEIDNVLKKAVAECQKRLKERKEKNNSGKNALALKEKFMLAILDGTIPNKQTDIRKKADILGIELHQNMKYYPILHDVKRWEEILRDWNKIDIDFCMKNIIREIFARSDMCETMVIPVYGKYYLTILNVGEADISEDDICSKCRYLNQTFKRLSGYGINSCAGDQCCVEELNQVVGELLEMSRREGSLEGAVVIRHIKAAENRVDYTGLIDRCYQEMLKGHLQELSKYVYALLEKMEAENDCNYYRMEDVARKYVQAAFAVLEIKNIDYKLVTENPMFSEKEKKASWGPASLKIFMEYINHTVLKMVDQPDNDRDVIYEIKSYVDKHLNEEISREELAKMVFLNEDYLSRLFRKQEGVSLTQYITEKKIEKAKKLLQIPEISVTMAAEGIGISNFPYFSKMFKRETGLSPSDYKKSYLKC